MNTKQIAYSHKTAFNAVLKKRLQMLMVILCIFGGISAVSSYAYDDNASKTVLLGSGTSMAMITMASIGDLDEVSAKESAANQIGMRIWLIDRRQIDDTVPFPEPNEDREVGTIPLKSGEYMHYFEAVNETPNSNSTGESGDINVEYDNMLSFVMAGNRKKLMTFIEEFTGRGFVVIWQECGTGIKYVQGSLCKPMTLRQFDRKDDTEGRYITFTFGNKHWRQPLIYTGDIVNQNPVTVPADATDLAYVSGNGRYQLTDNAAATVLNSVSGIGTSDYGKSLTIYGSGGTNPATIAENTTYVLVDGTTWTGNAGSTITFKIIDADTLVETGRTQTA